MICNLSYRKPYIFFVGLFVCFFIAFNAFAQNIQSKKNDKADEETVYIINEEVFVGYKEKLSVPKPKSKSKGVFDRVIAKSEKEDKEDKEDKDVKDDENKIPLLKIEGEEANQDVPYNERKHPYLSLLVDFINQIPDEQKQKLMDIYKEYLQIKDEIKEEIEKYFNETKPEQERQLKEKIRKITRGGNSDIERKLISEYKNHGSASSRLMSCMSSVTNETMIALAEIIPQRLFYSSSMLYGVSVDVLSYENVSKFEKYYLLPNTEGYFYNKTNAFVMFRAKDVTLPVKLNVQVNYTVCDIVNSEECKEYNDIFPLTIEPLESGKKSFIVSECSNLKELLKRIPNPEYSSIKLLEKEYDEKEKIALFSFHVSDKALSPSLSYYDSAKEKVVYGSSFILKDKVFTRIPFENDGSETYFEIRDNGKALRFPVQNLEEKKDGWKKFFYLVRMVEKGIVLNFITPSLLLLIAFLISFSGYGEGRIEKVRAKAKEILIGISLVFVLICIVLVVASSICPMLKFGFQFKNPVMNLMIIITSVYFYLKTKDNFFLKSLILTPLFIILPFTGIEMSFNYFYELGPVYILMLFLSIGLGFAFPYIMFLIFPEYVVALTPIDGVIYRFKEIRWLPLMMGLAWYIIVSSVVVFGLNKKGGEPFSIERLEQLINDKKTVYINISSNGSLSSLFSRLVILSNTKSYGKDLTVLRAEYHNKETRNYFEKIGIDSSDKSLFFGAKMPGGLIISETIIAGDISNFIKMVK